MKYLRPVYIGDEITARLQVIEVTDKKHILVSTICTNKKGEIVLSGVARLKKME